MPLNSRSKGAVGERELADELVRRGIMARRTVQYCGKTGDAADVIVEAPGHYLHIEVKRCERVRLSEWVDQAVRDSKGKPWCIFTRQSRRPWLVIQTIDQWVEDSNMAGEARAHRDEVINAALRAQVAGEDVLSQRQAAREAMDAPTRQMDSI